MLRLPGDDLRVGSPVRANTRQSIRRALAFLFQGERLIVFRAASRLLPTKAVSPSPTSPSRVPRIRQAWRDPRPCILLDLATGPRPRSTYSSTRLPPQQDRLLSHRHTAHNRVGPLLIPDRQRLHRPGQQPGVQGLGRPRHYFHLYLSSASGSSSAPTETRNWRRSRRRTTTAWSGSRGWSSTSSTPPRWGA